MTDEEDELPLFAYRTSLAVYGKERAVVVTYNPRTYRKKIHWLSRTILKTKRKLQELRRELRTADGRTTLQSIEKKVVEILAESHIAPVSRSRWPERTAATGCRSEPARPRFGTTGTGSARTSFMTSACNRIQRTHPRDAA